MGIDSFIPRRGENRRAGAAAEPSGSPRGLTAFVCDGAELDGTLSSRGTIRIDGRFGGKIVDADTVVVGESGDVQADIHAKNVIVSGAVAGDVCASRQIVLKPSARVKGSIGYGSSRLPTSLNTFSRPCVIIPWLWLMDTTAMRQPWRCVMPYASSTAGKIAPQRMNIS